MTILGIYLLGVFLSIIMIAIINDKVVPFKEKLSIQYALLSFILIFATIFALIEYLFDHPVAFYPSLKMFKRKKK